ncbi:MAG TPA: SRPBCC domain-containing protein [Ramlibacter sp.]|jgi:uncharacterized protein YndB with AHSA1/START domain|uniref:SRPBCC family protein n=1 Tax=Ramlibacter sp. TaxID=1917967 RepID=UPI002D2D7A1F|nr:SRPBCC domain-containing protein [Ramlibacter sp.]HZY17424.1 SRPBCC domain-containing protein [Ramlibacter sp.]
MVTSTIVRVQRAFACTADSLYDAWLDPDIARHFLFRAPAGQVIRCEIEPGVNGTFTIVDHRRLEGAPDTTLDVEHCGRFLQLDRPRRIAFSFSLPQFQSHETTVIIDIEPQGDGCELTLRHDLGLAEDAREMLERTEEGWSRMLANLELALRRE